MMSEKVLVFGVFDSWHKGHDNFLEQAANLGDELMVVVARDSMVKYMKNREVIHNEKIRLEAARKNEFVDEVMLGQEWPMEDVYGLLSDLEFNILAVGYDQKPSDVAVRAELDKRGKGDVKVVRLKPFEPDKYKSSFFR